VEESISGWVLGEETSVHNPGAEPFHTSSRWTHALGDGGCRFFGDNQKLGAIISIMLNGYASSELRCC